MAQTVTQNIFTDLPSKKPSRKYNTKVQTTDPWEDALEKACKSISDSKQVKIQMIGSDNLLLIAFEKWLQQQKKEQ